MITALAGSILKVSDRRKATAPTGPNPGSTPTSVPTNDPRKQNIKLAGVSATENPSATLARRSTLDFQNSGGQWNVQQPGKKKVGDQRGCKRYRNHLLPLLRFDDP